MANVGGKSGAKSLYDDPNVIARAEWYLEDGWQSSEFDDAVPLKESMAKAAGVTLRALQKWALDGREDWADIMHRCEEKQKRLLLNGALRNEFNVPTALRILGAHHGIREKSESDVNLKANIVTRDIPADMDPKEASRIYLENMRGGD